MCTCIAFSENVQYFLSFPEINHQHLRNIYTMSNTCPCRIFWILSYIATVLVLYNFTTTFVVTVSCGLLLVPLILLMNERCGDCVREAFLGSCIIIAGGLTLSLVVTGLQYGYGTTKCYFYECCDTRWIPANISGYYVTEFLTVT